MGVVTALTYVLPHRLVSSLARRLAYSRNRAIKQWLIDTVTRKFGVDLRADRAKPVEGIVEQHGQRASCVGQQPAGLGESHMASSAQEVQHRSGGVVLPVVEGIEESLVGDPGASVRVHVNDRASLIQRLPQGIQIGMPEVNAVGVRHEQDLVGVRSLKFGQASTDIALRQGGEPAETVGTLGHERRDRIVEPPRQGRRIRDAAERHTRRDRQPGPLGAQRVHGPQ